MHKLIQISQWTEILWPPLTLVRYLKKIWNLNSNEIKISYKMGVKWYSNIKSPITFFLLLASWDFLYLEVQFCERGFLVSWPFSPSCFLNFQFIFSLHFGVNLFFTLFSKQILIIPTLELGFLEIFFLINLVLHILIGLSFPENHLFSLIKTNYYPFLLLVLC